MTRRAMLRRATPEASGHGVIPQQGSLPQGRHAWPSRSLHGWPRPAPTLLSFFRAAQARFGVPWPFLAAIELVETRFGRIRGSSSAGAKGPMQFLPATWALYGHGSIDSPRSAILAAARLLAANGAP